MLSHIRDVLLPSNVNVVMTGRMLLLRPISKNELTREYLAWLNDPVINQYMSVRHRPQTFDTVAQYINALRCKPGCELLAIFFKKNHCHIGGLSLIEYDIDNGIASYGLMIGDHRAYQCGCGAEATLLYLTYIFADPKIRRVYVTVISSNRRAQQLIEEVGFQKEGVLRQHSVLASGEICDFYYYGMLKEEWGRYQDSFSDILKTARYEKF